jgi:arsenite methyltransferase
MSESCCAPNPGKGEAEKIREVVRGRYAEMAEKKTGEACGCVSESYAGLEGYVKDADLGLGCGLPTAFASLKPGETVVDLGSGAGNDVFVAARAVGERGRVIGIDFTPEMVAKAQRNREKIGAGNVEFRLGEIEALPLGDAAADVVISNCVLNLVPDKRKAFAEIHRVLKPGGRFTVSDIVTEGPLPEPVRRSALLWAGCVAGALEREEYLGIAREAGFEVKVDQERSLPIPEAVAAHLPVKILSVTVTGRKG